MNYNIINMFNPNIDDENLKNLVNKKWYKIFLFLKCDKDYDR